MRAKCLFSPGNKVHNLNARGAGELSTCGFLHG